MSREERNSKSFKYTTTSNESVSRKDYIPTKTTKSMTTESYDYLNQQSLSKNNITERPYYTFTQQSYSRYSSNRPNKQNLNSKFIAKKRIIKGNAKFSQGNSNLSGEKCTCDHPNENVQKKIFKCKLCGKNKVKSTVSQKNSKIGDYCTCDLSQKKILGKGKFGKSSGLAYGKNVGLAYGKSSGLAYGKNVRLASGKNSKLGYGKNVGLAYGKNSRLAYGKNAGLAYGKNAGLAYGKNAGLAYGKNSRIAYGQKSGYADYGYQLNSQCRLWISIK